LTGAESKTWDNRGHFFAAASEAMRRILIERARAKSRLRRGAGAERVSLDHVTVASDDPPDTVLAIDPGSPTESGRGLPHSKTLPRLLQPLSPQARASFWSAPAVSGRLRAPGSMRK